MEEGRNQEIGVTSSIVNYQSVNPNICHGQPCIKGTRIMVYTIIELLESGLTPDDIIKPILSRENSLFCLNQVLLLSHLIST